VGDLGKIGGQGIHIFHGELDRLSGFLTAGLHGGASRNDDDQLGPKILEDVGDRSAEAVSVGEQHDYRRNTPGHAEHG
jgi:hypothetical protein